MVSNELQTITGGGDIFASCSVIKNNAVQLSPEVFFNWCNGLWSVGMFTLGSMSLLRLPACRCFKNKFFDFHSFRFTLLLILKIQPATQKILPVSHISKSGCFIIVFCSTMKITIRVEAGNEGDGR